LRTSIKETVQPSIQDSLRFKLALPNHYCAPTQLPKTTRVCGVSLAIVDYLLAPIASAALGQLSLGASMAVPKASVDENDLSPTREYDVWFPRQINTM
jgi:hypothetical protein